MLTIGPIKGPQIFESNGWSTAKKWCQKLSGTHAARNAKTGGDKQ
jgi:hypothetical protein